MWYSLSRVTILTSFTALSVHFRVLCRPVPVSVEAVSRGIPSAAARMGFVVDKVASASVPPTNSHFSNSNHPVIAHYLGLVVK